MTTRDPASARRLHLVRIPGEFGPVVRCTGELSLATAEVLRREMAMLGSMGHPALTLNLTGCTLVDTDGVLALLDFYRQSRDAWRRFVLVAGTDGPARLLNALGIDWLLPVFPNERAAAQALRGGGPSEPAPAWGGSPRGNAGIVARDPGRHSRSAAGAGDAHHHRHAPAVRTGRGRAPGCG